VLSYPKTITYKRFCEIGRVNKKYPTAAKAAAVKKWIKWVMSDEAQKLNGKLLYTSIPRQVRQRVINQVNREVK